MPRKAIKPKKPIIKKVKPKKKAVKRKRGGEIAIAEIRRMLDDKN